MSKTNAEWELSKENIQPLQHGRTHGVLQEALTKLPDDNTTMQQQQAFEQELRTYSGDDPLSLWCRYIKWVEQNFPKGGRDGHIGKLIQRCLVGLKDDKNYYDDKRFIQIWLKYAGMTVKPSDIYDYMYSHNIGCKAADFYSTWSWEVEQLGNIKKANKILCEGLDRKAEPLDRLKAYCEEFENRVVKKVMTPSENLENSENVDSRSAFSVLKSMKKKVAPVVRTGENVVDSLKPLTIGGQQPLPKKNISSGKVPFKIYNAENIQPPTLPIQSENVTPFVLYSDQSKENEKKPSKWNKVRVKQVFACPSISSATPDFKLHCDEGQQPASTPRSVPKVSNILRPRKECDSPPMALFEPPDPKRIPMYDRKKVYGGGEEFSLEEIRAAAWHKKQRELEIQMKRQLAEQERLLEEQKEHIKNLEKQVEILRSENKIHTPSVSLKENECPSVLSTSQDSYPSNFLDASNQSAMKGTIRKELFPEQKLMTSYNEGTNVLLEELYNGTFDNPVGMFSNFKRQLFPSNPLPPETDSITITQSSIEQNNISEIKSDKASNFLPGVISPVINQQNGIPFTVFTDTTENQMPVSLKGSTLSSEKYVLDDQENVHSSENGENIPPEGYVQDTTKRQLNGILEPSKNVFFLPLEEQEEVEEEFNSDEEIIHGGNRHIQDETIPPCNTEQFFAADICASTPRTQLKKMKITQSNAPEHTHISGPYVATVETPNIENVSRTSQETGSKNDLTYKPGVKDQSTYPYTNLSVILESSREGYKSSSSSGSSAGATQLSHFYSHERTKHVSKIETFKEPLPPAQVEKEMVPFLLPEKSPLSADLVSDPFDLHHREQILQSVYASPDFDGIIKTTNKFVLDIKPSSKIIVGGDPYIITNLIAEDCKGKVYEAIHSETSKIKVALKFGKQSSRWEFYMCNTLHQRLCASGFPDVKLSIMKPIAAERFSDCLVLVHEFSKLRTIDDLVNMSKTKLVDIPELITMCLTMELLLIVSKLHECGILHCGITPNNVHLQENNLNENCMTFYPRKTLIIKLIDFSHAVDLKLYEKGICFKTPQYDCCIEMREGRPWVHQLDWYGVLDCVHLLLFSDSMKVKKNSNGKWGIERLCKYLDHADIWDPLFDELLNLSCYDQPDIKQHINKLHSKLKENISDLPMELENIRDLTLSNM